MTSELRGFTPSAFPRLRQCLGSVVLQRAEEVLPSMRRGTAIHRYLERISHGMTPAQSLALVDDEWKDDASAVDLDGLPPLASGSAEVGLLLDVEAGTARVVGVGVTREEVKAAARPGEIPMLMDWCATEGNCGVVIDHKTGRQEELARAAANLQVRTYAAAALLAFSWESVRYGLIRVDGDRPRWDMAEMDWLEAQDVLEEVRALRAAALAALEAHAATGAMPTLRLGPWCDWCPAARFCPARTRGVLAVLDGTAARTVEEAKTGTYTPEQLGAIYSRLLATREGIDTMLADIKTLAKQVPGGLPLPSGKVLGPVEKTTASPDPERVVAALAPLLGEEAAREALVTPPPKTSWDRIRGVGEKYVLPDRLRAWDENRATKKGRRPSAGTVAADLRKHLEACGAVKVSGYVSVEEVAPESPRLLATTSEVDG